MTRGTIMMDQQTAEGPPDAAAPASGLDVAVEEREAWKRRLTIKVSPDRVAGARGKELERVRSSVKLKGFRKGKVPPRLVEERYGPLIDERTVTRLVEESYRQALEDEDLHPIGEPSFGDVQYESGESLTFRVEFEVMPPIRLDRVGGFRIRRPEIEASEEEVEEVVERLRGEQAVVEPVDRPPREGDLVSVRITRLEDGEPETEPEGKPYRFELGAGYAIPEVEDAIRTLSPGSAEEFDVAFPEDFDDDELRGSTRRLRIELVDVKAKRLPALDDRFASEVGDFESLDALYDAVRDDVLRHTEEEAERAVRDRIVDAIIEANPFEVPPALVDRYLDQVIEAPEDADPGEVQAARQSLGPQAERRIKRHLVLERLVEQEGFEASDREVDERLAEMAERRGVQPSDLRRRLAGGDQLDSLRRQIAVEKVFGWLKEQSRVE